MQKINIKLMKPVQNSDLGFEEVELKNKALQNHS